MSTFTLPVPNLQTALVIVRSKEGKELGKGFIIPPWNSFFQQSIQKAPAVVDVSTQSPFTANAKGTLILTGATTITLIRGLVSINLNGERIIPISIADTVTWTGPATAQFLGT